MDEEHRVRKVPFIELAHRWRFRISVDEIHVDILGVALAITLRHPLPRVLDRCGAGCCQAPFLANSAAREVAS